MFEGRSYRKKFNFYSTENNLSFSFNPPEVADIIIDPNLIVNQHLFETQYIDVISAMENEIGGVIINKGIGAAENVTMYFYEVNDLGVENLIETKKIGKVEEFSFFSLNWTPQVEGTHNLKIVIDTKSDTDLTNNLLEFKADVHEDYTYDEEKKFEKVEVGWGLEFSGFFYDCETDLNPKKVYLNGIQINSIVTHWCEDLDFTLVNSNWPSLFLEIERDKLVSGNVSLEFDSKIALSKEFNLNFYRMVDYYFKDRIKGGKHSLYHCKSIGDPCAPRISLVERNILIQNSSMEVNFEELDKNRDYLLFLDVYSGTLNELDVLISDQYIGTIFNTEGYQRTKGRGLKIPKELISESLIITLNPKYGGSGEFDIKLVPILFSEYYLTIMSSPNAIPFEKDELNLYGDMTRRALDPSQYADIFFEDYRPDISIGRIFGLTISDASSYIAKDLFYNSFNKTNKMKFLASSGITFIKQVERWSNAFEEVGYDSKAVTSEEYCHSFSPVEWNNMDLIHYKDHSANSWAGIYSSDIPSLDNSLLLIYGCSTCEYLNKYMFCIRAMRKGAIGYVGTVSSIYGGGIAQIETLNNIYYNNFTIGSAFSSSYESDSRFYMEILIGDPTIDLKQPYSLKYKLKKD